MMELNIFEHTSMSIMPLHLLGSERSLLFWNWDTLALVPLPLLVIRVTKKEVINMLVDVS